MSTPKLEIAEFDEAPVDEFDGTDINAAGGLADDQQIRVALKLAGKDNFLLVAAENLALFRSGSPGRTSNSCISALQRFTTASRSSLKPLPSASS